jgi:hypothetical protein
MRLRMGMVRVQFFGATAAAAKTERFYPFLNIARSLVLTVFSKRLMVQVVSGSELRLRMKGRAELAFVAPPTTRCDGFMLMPRPRFKAKRVLLMNDPVFKRREALRARVQKVWDRLERQAPELVDVFEYALEASHVATIPHHFREISVWEEIVADPAKLAAKVAELRRQCRLTGAQ